MSQRAPILSRSLAPTNDLSAALPQSRRRCNYIQRQSQQEAETLKTKRGGCKQRAKHADIWTPVAFCGELAMLSDLDFKNK